jgi:hypothetical protein
MSINPSTNLTRLLSDDRVREVEVQFGDVVRGPLRAAADAVMAGIVVTRRRPAHVIVLTEDGRIDAMLGQGGVKLAAALEKRGAINIGNAQRGACDGGPLIPALGLKTIDPYDVTIAMPAEDGEPAVSDADRDAWQKFRQTYTATIEAPPYTVTGTLLLLPSQDPMALTERGSELFLPVFNPTIEMLGMTLKDVPRDSILVNRSHIKRVKATMVS